MAQLITLLVALIGMLILCLLISKRAIISPQFAFIACFIPGIVYAITYVKKWELDLSVITVGVILLGTSVFLVVSLLSNRLMKKKLKRNRTGIYFTFLKKDNISDRKLWIVFFLQVITLFMTIVFLCKYYGSNLSVAMVSFRRSSAVSDDYVALPGMIKMLRRMSLSAGFITMYIFVRGVVFKSKINRKMAVLCTSVAMLNGLMLGGRGDAIQLITAGVIQFLLISMISKGGRKIRIKSFIKILGVIILIILTFAEVGELMGRNMSFLKFGDYIAVYLSAELKNLDTFIRGGKFGATLSESQTMANLSHLFAVIIGDPSIEHKLTNPFRFIKGYSLGNVSTTFYGFMYDGGILGVVIFTSIMAIICQWSFHRAIKSDPSNRIELSIIIYSYIWYTIVFSFFSDKFYEMIFNTAFIWFVVGCLLIKGLLTFKVKLKGYINI